ncbi:MAG: ABC transporter permease [Pyrinomonadaceae bacterium]|nr:ABC transporter permease [Pyrinomonadaceae bacterium]
MPFEITLALRYLRSRRRGRLAHITAFAAAFGICLGVAGLITALALARGFQDELQDKILSGTAHLTLLSADGEPLDNWREAAERVRKVAGVTDVAATTYEGALLVTHNNNSTYTILRGVDLESAHAVAEARRTLVEGSLESLLHDNAAGDETEEFRDRGRGEQQREVAVIIGAGLAERAGLRVGDKAEIITGGRAKDSSAESVRSQKARVAGLFRSGLYEYDSTWCYLSLAAAAQVTGTERVASALTVDVRDIYKVVEIERAVRAVVGNRLTTVNWQEANRPLFAALALERRVVAFVIALIMIISALNITTSLVLLVVERRGDIAILRAMGARALSVMGIFVIEGASVGIVGASAGILFGLAVCFFGNSFRLVQLPADVYSLTYVPFHPRAGDVALTWLAAFAISLLATLYPARRAARVRPAETLRYE